MNEKFKTIIKKITLFDFFTYYLKGKRLLNDPNTIDCKKKSKIEVDKKGSRTEVINLVLSRLNRETTYLEIGVRDPSDNFIHIKATKKYSVDPGYEFDDNPVDFKLTSDDFFTKLHNGEILDSTTRFDVIFIDGLHLAEQADKDIINSLQYIKDDGFIVLHDCNPPTIWHAREDHYYEHTPATRYWNGTTWKAFLKWRFDEAVNSCCVDTNWGIGVLSKTQSLGKSINPSNLFYEYNTFDANRREFLNLMSFDDFKSLVVKILPDNI